ncbi:MAG TPA: HNH endonuclease [Polyangium sp.]|nr:HNH endonuclease [Polyangium sp.]
MMAFRRRSAPAFWRDKERAYLFDRAGVSAKDALKGWQHKNKKLSRWFHEEVRPEGEPRLCAYCDARLRESSPETIDHFVPEHAVPEWGLSWQNLYPSCSLCNSGLKKAKWSCGLLRPDGDVASAEADDLHAFLRWFSFEPGSGRLAPARNLERAEQARVRLTIGMFGLNESTRCQARYDVWQTLLDVAKPPTNHARLDALVRRGPYRFVALLFMAQYERRHDGAASSKRPAG